MNIKNLLLATTAILLTACSTDSDVLPPQDLGQIRVTASVGAMTRVAHSGNSTTFETNDRISVYAEPTTTCSGLWWTTPSIH